MNKIIIILFILLSYNSEVSAKKEKIIFDLRFGIIKGGEANIVIADTIFKNKKAIEYNLKVKTTGVSNALFGINDIYETTVDAETRLPLKAIRNIQEKKYRYYNETLFYHDIDSINSQRSGWSAVPHNLVDIVSVFFYFIHTNMFEETETGHSLTLPTFHADKISDVTVKFIGEEIIETDLGKIDCYILIPQVEKGKLLNRSDGLKLYISKEKKVPVLIEFDLKVGALRAVLKSYQIDGEEQITR